MIVPTLGRSHAIRPLLQSLGLYTPIGEARITFVLDRDDEKTQVEVQAAAAQGWDFDTIVANGTFPEKANAGVRATRQPWLLLAADDIIFHPNWLQAAAHLSGGAAVIGTNDLTPITADGRHATMPLVARSYIEDPGAAFGEPGVAFHEGYHHNFCETELCRLAQHRGVYVSCPASIIEHRHPSWGTREADETDARGGGANFEADEELFAKREALWA